MATHLSIVNSVLRRLREDEVNSITDTAYSKQIAEWVNDVRREVEERGSWTSLRKTDTITMSPGTLIYSLPNSNYRTKIQSIFDTIGYQEIREITQYDMTRWNIIPISSNLVGFYKAVGIDTSGLLQLQVYPNPSTANILQIKHLTPDEDIAVTIADDSTSPNVDGYLIVLGVVARALEERGDDQGQSALVAQNIYQKALADALLADINHNREDSFWVVD